MHTSRWLITQVYNGQLTHVTESLTHRELQRYLFFPLRTALCSLGSGMSLMMQSDSKMTHPAMCLDHHESNNFSTVYAWRIKFGHTYSYPYQYIYIYYLNLYNNINTYIYIYMNILHIKTHCWFDQTMADVCWQMYPFGQIYYRSLLDISHWEALSISRSSQKALS